MKILLVILFLSFPVFCLAENKIYFDTNKNMEVCDISGLKTVEQINKEFKGNFTDVTKERTKQLEENKISAKEKVDQKEADNKQKEKAIKQKLNLSDKEFEDLKEILKR